jgi:hypothetical protein
LRRLALFSFACWAVFVLAALRYEGVVRAPENHLRLAVALGGTALTLFTVARSGEWPRLLYLACVGYFAYFAAGSPWHGLWQVAAVPAEGTAETLALTFELAGRTVARHLAAERYALAFTQAYDLAVMPLIQLAAVLYLARALIRGR